MGAEGQTRSAETVLSSPELWPEVLELPCHLYVELEVAHFTVRDLLDLHADCVVDTQRREGANVPVKVNGVMVGWAEFDVIEDRLSVRLTEML